jgi:outer membrane protein assembly factor BamB
MKDFYKYVILAVFLYSITGCSKDTKLTSTGTYVDFSDITSAAQPDNSLQYYNIEIPTAQQNTDWTTSSFSLEGVSENVLVKSNLSKINTYDLYKSSATPDMMRNPIISNNILFVLDNENTVYAYDASNPGILIWKKHLNNSGAEFLGGGITVKDTYLAATYGNKDLVLLDPSNGDEVWRYNLSNISRAAPIIVKGDVLALTVDNKLYCIELGSGLLKWTHESASEEFGMIGNASPEAKQNFIIVPSSSGQISALDSSTGELKWDTLLSSGTKQAYLNDIDMTPVIVNKTVYVSNYSGNLFAINLASGITEWSNPNGGGNNSIWIAEDYIYSINKDKKLLAIYKETGAIKWVYNLFSKSPTDKKYTVKFNGPIMVNGQLYICSSNGELIIIDAKTGKKIKQKNIIKDIYSPPIAANNKIYLFSNSGTLSIVS